jgi:putative copper resistance protein D
VGVICVLLLAGTAFFQATELIGSLAALVGTEYGRVALLKLGAFLVLLALAAGNRFVFTARLSGAPGHHTCSPLLLSIAVETTLGLLVVLAASWLSSLAPGINEQAT